MLIIFEEKIDDLITELFKKKILLWKAQVSD